MDNRTRRLQKLTEILQIKNAGTIKDLAQSLNVSEMTIRRDLFILAEKNIVKQIHGGAIYNHTGIESRKGKSSQYNLSAEEHKRTEDKLKIARKAVSLIESDDIIIIDSGSTTELMGEFIQTKNPSTIICYALNVLFSIFKRNDCKLIFSGGYFNEDTMMFESKEGVELIRHNRANKAFMSARGISDRLGITTADPYEIQIKRAVIESSQQRILLVDSSKFDKVRLAYYGELEDFDIIITDSKIPQNYIELIEELEIELIIV